MQKPALNEWLITLVDVQNTTHRNYHPKKLPYREITNRREHYLEKTPHKKYHLEKLPPGENTTQRKNTIWKNNNQINYHPEKTLSGENITRKNYHPEKTTQRKYHIEKIPQMVQIQIQ